MTTLYRRIHDPAELDNPNIVKVVVDRGGFALYFSRAPIPVRPRPARRLAAALSTYRPLRVSPQRAAGAGRRSSRRRSNGPNRSSSCARSSTASASRPWKPRTTRSASTRRKISKQVRRLLAAPSVELSGSASRWPGTSRHMTATKYIFVTGGVVSSLGKGLAAASIGACSKATATRSRCRSSTRTSTSIPGTMSPYQHGEVYVTDDGARDRPRPRPLRALHQHASRRRTRTGRPARSIRASSRRSGAATTSAAPCR